MQVHRVVDKANTEAKMIESLLVWINSFSWEENVRQTDAQMELTITGIAECHLEERVDVSAINTHIIKRVVKRKASQFVDVHVIEGLSWRIEDIKDECGHPMKQICISAGIHLAEPGMPFDGAPGEV